MNTIRLVAKSSLDQHIALAEEVFGTGLIQNDGRLCAALHGKRNAPGNVAANQAGEGFRIRAPCCQHQMDAGSTRLLSQPDDVILNIAVLQDKLANRYKTKAS